MSEVSKPQSETTLKPCPFCGHAATFGRIGDIDSRDHGGEYVSCDNPRCEVTTPLIWPNMEDVRPLLAERWNRREP